MREIKFRILKNEDDYKAWEDITIDDFIDNELFLSSKVYNKETLSQFTGIKDKNGKEIYEGDIVSGNICDSFIEFDNFIVENLTGTKFEVWNGINTVFDLHDVYECEVIGNIFENPELLN